MFWIQGGVKGLASYSADVLFQFLVLDSWARKLERNRQRDRELEFSIPCFGFAASSTSCVAPPVSIFQFHVLDSLWDYVSIRADVKEFSIPCFGFLAL